MGDQAAINNALASAKDGDIIKLTGPTTGNIYSTKLIGLNLNGQTLTGNVSLSSNSTGTVGISAGTITGNLTVNTPNATINNFATVNGTVTINNVAQGTWNEKANDNKIVVNDPDGIVLNVAANKEVGSLTLNKPTTVNVGSGATFTTPVQVKANSTIVADAPVQAVIAKDIKVTVKETGAEEGEGTVVTGTDSTEAVDVKAEADKNDLKNYIATISEEDKKIAEGFTTQNKETKITEIRGTNSMVEMAKKVAAMKVEGIEVLSLAGNTLTSETPEALMVEVKQILTDEMVKISGVSADEATIEHLNKKSMDLVVGLGKGKATDSITFTITFTSPE